MRIPMAPLPPSSSLITGLLVTCADQDDHIDPVIVRSILPHRSDSQQPFVHAGADGLLNTYDSSDLNTPPMPDGPSLDGGRRRIGFQVTQHILESGQVMLQDDGVVVDLVAMTQ